MFYEKNNWTPTPKKNKKQQKTTKKQQQQQRHHWRLFDAFANIWEYGIDTYKTLLFCLISCAESEEGGGGGGGKGPNPPTRKIQK